MNGVERHSSAVTRLPAPTRVLTLLLGYGNTAGHPLHDLESEGWLNLDNATTSHGLNLWMKLVRGYLQLQAPLNV